MRKIDKSLLIVVIGLISACAPQTTPLPTVPVASPTPFIEVPADWHTYSDTSLGFSISHPPDWEVCTTTEHSRVFCRTESEGLSFPVFYITVTPSGFSNDDASAYNFFPEEVVNAFEALAAGETFTVGDPNPDYSTFTRLPDVSVDGETGLQVENINVWEGRPDTKDRRVFVRHGETLCLLGMYYESPAEAVVFETVLTTFKFGKGD